MEFNIKRLVPKRILSFIIQQKLSRKFKGDAVCCPICESTFKAFAPFGHKMRGNARCLTCNSLERHRLVFSFLKNEKKLFSGTQKIKVLHFAPEPVFYDIFRNQENIEYYPCDLFPEVYKEAVMKMDITKIDFESETFDVVICNHVLEHIPDDHLAMSELYRVMKFGGWGIFQVPIDYSREKTYEDFSITSPKEREKAFGQNDHVRWYGRDYKDRLANAKFVVIKDDYISRFTSDEISKYGFMKGEQVYLCEKHSE